jgi:PAS domain S-box-containing protein
MLPRNLDAALAMMPNSAEAIVITECNGPTFCITNVNKAWQTLCGYTDKEVVGKTLKMIQGPMTCRDALQQFEDSIRSLSDSVTTLINYKKDGSTFENRVRVVPLMDTQVGKVTHFLGVLEQVNDP